MKYAVLVSLALAGCVWIHPTEPRRRRARATLAEPRFEEIAVDFAHRWDRTTSHHLTGAAVLDLDGDGREEIFVGGGAGQPDALLALEDGRLVDRIAGTGLSSLEATYGSCAIDLDGDGDVDLVVARNDGVTLYLNDGGGRFQRRAPAGRAAGELGGARGGRLGHRPRRRRRPLPERSSSTSRTSCRPPSTCRRTPRQNRLLRNDGNLRFTDVTTPATRVEAEHLHLALRRPRRRSPTRTWWSRRTPGRSRSCATRATAASTPVPFDSGYGFWMGVAAGDVDGDGDQDLSLHRTSATPSRAFAVKGDRHDDQPYDGGWLLLRNDGGFHFTDVTREAGLDGIGFAWGAVFEDMNLDGQLDLMVSQNYVKWPVHRWFKFPGKLLLGGGPASLPRLAGGVENRAFSNSPVIADLDGDARPDLFWLNNDGPSRAYLNRTRGQRGRRARCPTPCARSARACASRAAAPGYTREVASSSGLGTDQSPELVFGLGAERSCRPSRDLLGGRPRDGDRDPPGEPGDPDPGVSSGHTPLGRGCPWRDAS